MRLFEFTVFLLEPIFAAPPFVVAGTQPGGPQAGSICPDTGAQVNARRFNEPSTLVQQISQVGSSRYIRSKETRSGPSQSLTAVISIVNLRFDVPKQLSRVFVHA
jgi:hypothetical protein